MKSTEFTFNIHNTTFFGKDWVPKNPKAVVILIHGMGEHIMRYTTSVIPKLVDNNIAVVGFDMFGHGKTSGKRGHNPNFEAVLDSVQTVINKVKSEFKELPIFLYGHSMGGNVVLNYALRRQSQLKGVIATSPFLKLAFEPPKWKLSLGKVMQKVAPSVTLGNELNANDISRDKTEVQKYIDDPLVHDKVSPNYSLTFIDTGAWAIKNASKNSLPTFILHGTADKIIDYKGSQAFADNSDTTSIKLFDGGFHELHNDFCKEEMLTAVVGWFDDQLKL